MAFDGQQLQIFIGQDGYNANQNVSQAAPTELIQAENVTFESGTMQKEGGSSIFGNVGSVSVVILGGHDWMPALDGSIQRSILIGSDSVVRSDAGRPTGGDYPTIMGALANMPNSTPVFVEGGRESGALNRKLFIYTGTNQLKVINGDASAIVDVANPPSDWATYRPLGGCIHINRHWGFGGQNPHYLYASLATDHEDFVSAGAVNIPVYPGVGERIIGVTSFKGHLVVWKYPRGLFYLDTSAAAITSWFTVPLSHEVGMASPTAWCPLDDDILFMDATGSIHLLSSVLDYGDYGLRAVSDIQYMRNFILNNVNRSLIKSCQAVFYLAKREAHFALPGATRPYNTLRIKVDFNRPDKIRFNYSTKQFTSSIWLARDLDGIPRLMGGDWNGNAWKLDQDIKSVNGAGYPSIWQTPHLDFSDQDPALGTHRKNFKFLELIMEPEGNWSVTVDVYLDGRYSQTLSFFGGHAGAVLGSFVLGSDVLGAANVVSIMRRLVGSGKRISLVGTASGPDQDFSISKAYVYLKPAGESNEH